MRAYRVAALAFGAWGLLHVAFGAMMLLAGVTGTAADTALVVATGTPDLVGAPGEAVGGLLAQHPWNLVWAGAFAFGYAFLNWKGKALITNTIVITAFDVGFIVWVLVPGYIALQDGLLGPALWIVGAVAALYALRSPSTRDAARSSTA